VPTSVEVQLDPSSQGKALLVRQIQDQVMDTKPASPEEITAFFGEFERERDE
jgi:hypothetical protein